MVARSLCWFALLLACSACASNSDSGTEPGLLLHGFRLVDPNERSVREADVCIEHGVVITLRVQSAARAASRRYRCLWAQWFTSCLVGSERRPLGQLFRAWANTTISIKR